MIKYLTKYQDSLKSLAYYRQRIQKPNQQTPRNMTNKLWDEDPRLWTALYVYRMKYILK